MAIVEKYRYGLTQPSRGQDQINGMVAIDIPRLDPQAANRTHNANRLPPGRRKLKPNPVVGTGRVGLPGLNAGYIGAKVPVEIGDRKLCPRSDRSDTAPVNICGLRCAEASETKEHRQRNPQE